MARPGCRARCWSSSGSDKEYLHVDSYPGLPYKDNIYESCTRATQKFARSTDKGLTFSTQTLDSQFKGIGSDINDRQAGQRLLLFPSTRAA